MTSKCIIYFGSFDPNYSRNRIIRKALEANRVKVLEDQSSGIMFIRYFKLTSVFLKVHSQVNAIVVGFPGHYDVPLAFVLGKVFRKKVFYDIFASTYETYVLDRKVVKEKSLRSKFFYLLDWVGLTLADYVLVDTKAHGKFYQNLYGMNPKKQIVVYLGSDTDYFYPRKIKETTDVLFYGSYQPLQGTEVIIKAAKKLPKVKFKMIGEGQERASAESLAKNLKLKNVQFIDWLPLKKLAVEIRQAKICLGIFGKSEKADVVIPNKIYDYIACKKAVITKKTAAADELFSNSQNCMLVRTNKDLVSSINLLLKNNNIREKIVESSYNFYLNYLNSAFFVKELVKNI